MDSRDNITLLQNAIDAFFKKNDRFPTYVFVGLGVYNDLIHWMVESKRFINRLELLTVLGKRIGIEFNGMPVLPTAHLADDAIGEMEAIFVSQLNTTAI